MSILTTKNIFFFLVFINLNYILCEKSKCSTIEHCLKCSNENKCDKCEFGYRLNDDETKCERKKMIKRRLDKLNNSSSTENDTLENSTISKNEETNLTNSNCSSNKPSTSSNKEAESSRNHQKNHPLLQQKLRLLLKSLNLQINHQLHLIKQLSHLM